MIGECELFTKALCLPEEWFVTKVELQDGSEGKKELHMWLDFKKGTKFKCPEDGCGELAPACDTREHVWRHLDFFQYRAFIHARVPGVNCPKHGVKTAGVPWARPGSGFTLLFESMAVLLAQEEQEVLSVSRQTGVPDTTLWRILRHYVQLAREKTSFKGVTAIGMDETSIKGHSYITLCVDLNGRRVIAFDIGKDAKTVGRVKMQLEARGGCAAAVEVVTCDMALGFKAGIREHFPNGCIVIDKFHAVKLLGDKIDALRRIEAAEADDLKNSRYLWLKNDNNLSKQQLKRREDLICKHPKLGKALVMREELQAIYGTETDPISASKRLKRLISWMNRCRIDLMKQAAKTLKENYEQIINYFRFRKTNAQLEGVNSVVQNIKRRARGFRNLEFFETMIFLVCGKLPLREVVTEV